MQSKLVGLLEWMAENNFLIAITAGLAALSPYVLFHFETNFILGVVVLFATFFTYTTQRILGDHIRWSDLPIWKKGLLIVSAAIIAFLVFYLSPVQVILLFLGGGVSFLYAMPIFRRMGTVISLRQFPYLKIWLIVLVWVLVICLTPMHDLSGSIQNQELLLGKLFFVAQQGAFIFSLTVPFDIRDLKVDHPSQKTIPMIFGIESAIGIAQSALWLSFFFTAFNFLFGFFDLEVVFFQLLVVLLGRKLLKSSKVIRSNAFYLIRIDGLIAIQSMLFLLSYFI